MAEVSTRARTARPPPTPGAEVQAGGATSRRCSTCRWRLLAFFGAGEASTPAAHAIPAADGGRGSGTCAWAAADDAVGGERQRLKLATGDGLRRRGVRARRADDEFPSPTRATPRRCSTGWWTRAPVIVIEHHQAVMAHADGSSTSGGAGRDGAGWCSEGRRTRVSGGALDADGRAPGLRGGERLRRALTASPRHARRRHMGLAGGDGAVGDGALKR